MDSARAKKIRKKVKEEIDFTRRQLNQAPMRRSISAS
jgi:hypothetical protein